MRKLSREGLQEDEYLVLSRRAGCDQEIDFISKQQREQRHMMPHE